ncbi:MAG: dTDP-4-dehydrorhamnose reductase [Planctomycetota bacterium]
MTGFNRIGILGANGMLGRAVAERCQTLGIEPRLLSETDIDLSRPFKDSVVRELDVDAVMNCAAWTDVDGAESAEDQATVINGEGVGRLAKACAVAGVPIVHYSTDYVFDGRATSPYATDHPRDPLNAYGRSKAVGEIALEQSDADWLCVRTSWLYAPWGKNFVLTMAKLLPERDDLKVVDDQVGRPTSARQLAERSIAMLRQGFRGMAHGTDGGECSWHEFACAIADSVGVETRPASCGSDAFPRPAKRPAYSVLDIRASDDALGPARPWTDELASVLREASRSNGVQA